MSKYGCGVGLVQEFEMDKEQIIHALNGELAIDEAEDGFVYDKFSKEDCDEFIMSAFLNACFHALQGYRGGRVLERILLETGMDAYEIFKKYRVYEGEEVLKDYKEAAGLFGDEEGDEGDGI